jgi:hypothetical protein
MKTYILFGLLTWTALIVEPARVSACACCTYGGEWSRWSEKLGKTQLHNLTLLQLVNGQLDEEVYAERDHSVLRDGRGNSVQVLGFTVKMLSNKIGRITFKMLPDPKFRVLLDPKLETLQATVVTFVVGRKADFFEADVGFLTKTAEPPPLYHEVVLEGTLVLDGPLQKYLRSNKIPAKLVLSGKGPNCWDITQYDGWQLLFQSQAMFTVEGSEVRKGALPFKAGGTVHVPKDNVDLLQIN